MAIYRGEIVPHEIPDPAYKREAEKAFKEGNDARDRLLALALADLVVDIALASSAEKMARARDRLAEGLYKALAKK